MKSFNYYITERKQLTLQFHKELNPKFWNKDKELDPKVKTHLLKIAEAWAEFSDIPKSAIKDIYFTGGNCNFNYTKFSDVDIHLALDMKNMLFEPRATDHGEGVP